MTLKIVTVPQDDALDAFRRGAHDATRDALHAERGAFAEIARRLEDAYVFKAWFTADDVCRYVGIWPDTPKGRKDAVRKMHDAGLPFVVLNRQRLTRRDELDAWIATSRLNVTE